MLGLKPQPHQQAIEFIALLDNEYKGLIFSKYHVIVRHYIKIELSMDEDLRTTTGTDCLTQEQTNQAMRWLVLAPIPLMTALCVFVPICM